MLPRDDDAPAENRSGQNPMPDEAPGTPPTPAPTSGPPPTGLLDEPILGPVPVTPVLAQPERRRGWAFTASLVLVTVLGGSALFMSGYTVGRDTGQTPPGEASDAEAWQPFWDAYVFIRDKYPLEPIERNTLIEGAIRGMVESVGDPYSSYLSPQDFTGTLNDISGTFEGIGAEIGAVDAAGNAADCATFGPDCHLVIIAPIEGSPAEKAGLKPGDVISQIDGSTLDGLTPDQARDRVRGKAGTEVKLHIQRFEAPKPVASNEPPAGATASPDASPNASPAASSGAMGPDGTAAPVSTPKPRKLLDEFDITLVRAKIQRREVTSRELAGGTVGYVSLSGFSSAGAAELKAAMKAHVDKGIRKIVFDLRGNPGGFLLDALDVASQFIPDGPIYWQEDQDGNQRQTDAKPGGVATDPSIRVVVLIDRGSASASEIVAAALQDRGRAKLVGETSFGKGTVQEWLELGEVGGVKLTVAKWLTPNKRWIHRIGLTPDVAVTVPPDNPPGKDPVLDKALEVLDATTARSAAFLRAA
jgi:carboxyl-terminal processing protease